MDVKNFRLADIKPYEKNPRKNDSAVTAVAKSIEQFGFKVPLVIDSNNVIVCGHTRYKAAKRLNLATVPCVVADDLTPEQVKAFRLADNKVAEFATWDFELLDAELNSLSCDLNEFGFHTANVSIDAFWEKTAPAPPTKNDTPATENVDSEPPKEIDAEPPDEASEQRIITCPHCGQTFEL